MNDQTMTQTEINICIENAFNNLSALSEQCYDYWISELFDENDSKILSEWNEQNLQSMERDVMHLTIFNDD